MSIETQIEAIVRAQLGETSGVEEVRVEEAIDDDGDIFYRVTVVYNGKKLDTEKAKGMVRHLRSALTFDDGFRFPLLSYRSKRDDMRLRAATA